MMATLCGENICVKYGKMRVLHEVTVRFTEPEVVSIIGPNGSGKSTLMKALSRLLPVSSGEVLLEGIPFAQYTNQQVARKIAILPQSATAPPGMNAYRLVSCGRSPHHSYFEDLQQMDMDIIENVMRETDVWRYRERSLESLSGGERQRVWLAMALAQEPDILMLDEPTTYLDIRHQLHLMDVITQTYRQRQITIIMVLHDLNQAARYSHRLIAMKDGKIVGDGVPDAVLTSAHIQEWFGVRMRSVQVVDGHDKHTFYMPLAVDMDTNSV